MFTFACKEDRNSWLEILDNFDSYGKLHIAVNEMIIDRLGEFHVPRACFKEQCVYMKRDEVEWLIDHLKQCLQRPNFGEHNVSSAK